MVNKFQNKSSPLYAYRVKACTVNVVQTYITYALFKDALKTLNHFRHKESVKVSTLK